MPKFESYPSSVCVQDIAGYSWFLAKLIVRWQIKYLYLVGTCTMIRNYVKMLLHVASKWDGETFIKLFFSLLLYLLLPSLHPFLPPPPPSRRPLPLCIFLLSFYISLSHTHTHTHVQSQPRAFEKFGGSANGSIKFITKKNRKQFTKKNIVIAGRQYEVPKVFLILKYSPDISSLGLAKVGGGGGIALVSELWSRYCTVEIQYETNGHFQLF